MEGNLNETEKKGGGGEKKAGSNFYLQAETKRTILGKNSK